MSFILRVVGLAIVAVALSCVLAASPASARHVCQPTDPLDCNHIDDPPPPAPPCGVDEDPTQPGARRCTPGPTARYLFQAADPSNPTTGDNRCEVVLKAGYPDDQSDPRNRPDVQHRTSISCQKPLQVMTIIPELFTATGVYRGSAQSIQCHALSASPCQTFHTTRGGGVQEPGQVYTLRVYARLVLPGGPDPWVETSGLPADSPTSCAPGGLEIRCVLTLQIPVPADDDDLPT